MRCDFSMVNTRMRFATGALIMCLASTASAGTIVGGGATLPVIGYTGTPASSPIAAASLFGVYINLFGNSVTYCPTGDGAGKKILAGNDVHFQVTSPCGTVLPVGFGGSGLTQPHFVGADAPLTLSEYNAYSHLPGQPTQLPAIAGAIGIVFKKVGVNSLTLNEDQICGVFSGQIKTWQDLRNSGAIGIPVGTIGNINIAYQADSSGTSFSFLNHLAAVCPVASHPVAGFQALPSYATGAAAYFSSYASSSGGNGDAGVIAVVIGTLPGAPTDGSIGYASVASGVRAGVKMASVTNLFGFTVNPVTGFGPTPVPVTLTYDKVMSDGGPTLINLSTSSNGCIGMVDPATYANPISPVSPTYPIIAISYLLGNTQGNGSDITAVRSLLGMPYNTAVRTSIGTIGRVGTGYAWLTNADLTQSRVNSCIVN